MADHVITISDTTRDEAGEIVLAVDGIQDDLEIKVITSKGFLGIGEVTLLISAVGGGVLVKQLAKVVVAWMNRHDGRRVKIGKVEITGYSVDEVERILEVATAS